MPAPGTLLVVCTGNVCRSPYLHRRLQLALGDAGTRVVSAGTGALAGYPMDPEMARHLGADADPSFVARDLRKDDVLGADLVLTATRDHRTLATRLAPRALRTTFAAADFAQLADAVPDAELASAGALYGTSLRERVLAIGALRAKVTPLPPELADIADPFRGTPQQYADAAAQIDSLVPRIVRVLR